jgi:hypothetical protein
LLTTCEDVPLTRMLKCICFCITISRFMILNIKSNYVFPSNCFYFELCFLFILNWIILLNYYVFCWKKMLFSILKFKIPYLIKFHVFLAFHIPFFKFIPEIPSDSTI